MNELQKREKELSEKLRELTKKYGLSATQEQQKEVIAIGQELEDVRAKLGENDN